jgi:hypothetical protein
VNLTHICHLQKLGRHHKLAYNNHLGGLISRFAEKHGCKRCALKLSYSANNSLLSHSEGLALNGTAGHTRQWE